MARAKKRIPKHRFGKDVEKHIASVIIDSEYQTSKSNRSLSNEEFESFVNLFDGEGSDRDYDWMSDISLPEFPSHMLTQSSIDVSQYFQSRDFVETYIQDESDEAKLQAESAKECINRTLNQRHLHHYQKYVRAKLINHLMGSVYLECWWEQELKTVVTGTEQREEELDVDEYGNPLVDLEVQRPATRIVEEDITEEVPVVDRFNYDIHDPRNVFTNNKYVYSLQDKDFITFRSEKSIHELKQDAAQNGYFNLEILENIEPDMETETSRESYNKEDGDVTPDKTPNKKYDILKRYGKFWCKVVARDEEGEPTDVEPAYDKNGDLVKDAELHEMIVTHAMNGNSKILIGFHLTPYIDAEERPFKPIIRGLCYIHPSRDEGAGDGKYARELQTAIDDTFNIGNDRVMLATMPTLKTKKYTSEDNDTIFFEPGHRMELENLDDVEEFRIDDNIVGALNQIGMLTGKMQQVTSIYPTTMGQTPADASTTATAVAGAESRTDMRTNYKSLTFENTALQEMYWMILQMTWTFAKPQTGIKLMGQKVYNFDPTKDYFYKPVSASIESEQSKGVKVQRWTQVLGYVVNLQHPDAPNLANYILSQIFQYMGDEYANFSGKMLDPNKPLQPEGNEQVSAEAVPTSNQYGNPQSMTEQGARGSFNA